MCCCPNGHYRRGALSLETNRRRDGDLKRQEAGDAVVPCFICVAPGGREDFTKRVMMIWRLRSVISETLRSRLTLDSYISLSQEPEITVSDALWTSMTKDQLGNLSPRCVRLTSRGGKVPSNMLRPDRHHRV